MQICRFLRKNEVINLKDVTVDNTQLILAGNKTLVAF